MSTEKKQAKPTKRKKNLLIDHPAWAERLSKEWDWEKNDEMDIKPDEVTAGSGKKVAWKCEKGHRWEAQIVSRKAGSGCPYCSGRLPIAGKTDLATTNPGLSTEWHPVRNDGLGPQDVTGRSGKKVWWLGECGHEWQASVSNRARLGYGCPYCSGRLPIVGETDLATTHPDLAAEWHPTKNDGLTPKDVMRGSTRKVWWLGACGHEWQATANDRSRGHGCPYCSGRLPIAGETDLATLMPDVASEWHPTKNGDLTPRDVTKGSSRKVWWLGECGHEWEQTVVSRAGQGHGCPYCSGRRVLAGFNDLATINPALAAEWHPTKNDGLTPQDVGAGSHRKVWWLGECGHEWQASIHHRISSGTACPYCRGKSTFAGENDLSTTYPDIASEWHPTRNHGLKPTEVRPFSNIKVWWQGKCGHNWEAVIANRTRMHSGCPICSSSKGEKDAASWASSQGFVIGEQWRDPACRDQKPLPFDMMLFAPAGNALMEIAVVEYDGVQHSNPDAYFNMKSLPSGGGFDYVVRHDAIKTEFCESTGRVLIRVPHTVTGVEDIGAYIEEKLRENDLDWALDDANQPMTQSCG